MPVIERNGNKTVVHTDSGDVHLEFLAPDDGDEKIYDLEDRANFRANIEDLFEQRARGQLISPDNNLLFSYKSSYFLS